MIRTGAQYRDSIRDGRQVYIGGERVKDVTTHPSSSRSWISAPAFMTCSTSRRRAIS
jgi:aromatic ring hydroxylase